MSSKSLLNVPEYRIKLKKSDSNDNTINVRWEMLPEHRHEEYVDFLMKYYVKYEITHVVAGICTRAEAVEEYRQFLLHCLKEPLLVTAICCVDGESEIIAAYSTILHRKGDIKTPIQAETPEVKRFFEIIYAWEELCSVEDVLALYNADSIFEDMVFAVRPDYGKIVLSNTVAEIREAICKENQVALAGFWITSLPIQKAAETIGCTKTFEITFEELEKKLNIKFNNPPPTFCYYVKRAEC